MAESPGTPPQKKKRTGLLIVGAGCGCLFLFTLILLGGYLYAGWRGNQESSKLVQIDQPSSGIVEEYFLSAEQENQIYALGYPEAFTILFYEEETVQGDIAVVRLESWEYYSQGIGLTFINGELITEDMIENTDLGPIEPLPYFPEQFTAFMSLEDLVSAAGISSYAEIPLDRDLIKDGVMYYSYALTFGLKDNELIYIEALALSEE